MMRRETRSKEARHQLTKKATANMLPTTLRMNDLKNCVLLSYLKSKLTDETGDPETQDFILVIMNLVGMMTLRNASRSGTVTTMRTEYIDAENLTYALESELQSNLRPKALSMLEKVPGNENDCKRF